jgi:hypothetical protein
MWTAGAIVFATMAVLAAIFFFATDWIPTADFDILGFAWMFLNAPRLGAFVIMILCSAMSGYLVLRAWLS